MALYSVMRPEGNKWVRFGRQHKSVTAAVRLANRWKKAYVEIVGGENNGEIIYYNCKRSGHLTR